MKEQILTLDDGVLPYLHWGDGPLVVLTHALGPVAWGSLDQLMRSCSVAVLVGERSTIPAEARITLKWFQPLVRDLGFEHAALCAWSMAGPAVIEYAAGRPAALRRLILVDVAGLGSELGSNLPPLRLGDLPHLLLTKLLGRPTRGFVRMMWRSSVHSSDVDTAPLIEATYRFFRAEPGGLMGPPDEDDDDEALHDVLAAIDVPTLVLAGRHSLLLGPDRAQEAASTLPRGRPIVFEHSSHTLQLEEPAKFQEVVAAFVNDTSA